MDKFNSYVELEILPNLNTEELSPDQILTGLQYILVNERPDYEGMVLELLMMYHVGDQAEEIYESALRVAEYYDIAPRVLIRALVESLLDQRHSRRNRLYKSVMLEMGKEAALIMLDMLKPPRKTGERQSLVGLIEDVSGVKPPQIRAKWGLLTDAQLIAMKQAWERMVDPEGKIRAELDDHNIPGDPLVILPPIDPGDSDGPTEEVGGGAMDGGENRERLGESKTKERMPEKEEEELVDVRQGTSSNAQTPRPSAPSMPTAQPKPMEWQLMQWSTYTAPMWVLLGGMVVSLIGMIYVVIRYRRARRRRIQGWNLPSRT